MVSQIIPLQDPIDPAETCPGPSGNVTHYQINFQTGAFVKNLAIYVCKGGKCSHTFEPPSNPPSSYYKVSVAAENVVGVGAVKLCSTQIISELVSIIIFSYCKANYYNHQTKVKTRVLGYLWILFSYRHNQQLTIRENHRCKLAQQCNNSLHISVWIQWLCSLHSPVWD